MIVLRGKTTSFCCQTLDIIHAMFCKKIHTGDYQTELWIRFKGLGTERVYLDVEIDAVLKQISDYKYQIKLQKELNDDQV